jgi:hypothetical protein
MKEACGYVEENDGTFWMSIEDFCLNTDGVDVARTFDLSWKKITQYSKFVSGPTMANVIESREAEADDEITLTEGEEIEITGGDPTGWFGTGEPGTENYKLFLASCVECPERPVRHFSISTSAKKVRAHLMLMHPKVELQRKYTFRKEYNLNCKDTSYVPLELLVVDDKGKVMLRSSVSESRLAHGEVILNPGVKYDVYAWSPGGRGKGFCLRTYIKGGQAELTEEEDSNMTDVSAFLG